MVYVDKESLESLLGLKASSSLQKPKNHKQTHFNQSSQESICSHEVSVSGNDNKKHSPTEAFKKIERLVKVRDRSIAEVRARLEKDEFVPDVIDQAIQRACECSYLDDARFADVLIRSRLRAKKGMVGIVSELKRHGIDPETQLPDFPQAYLSSLPDQKDTAVALLCKKPPRAKNKMQAAYAKLIRSGYSSSVASDAAREWYRLHE